MEVDVVIWGILLVVCKIYGNVEIGEWIVKRLVSLDIFYGVSRVFLFNFYVDVGRWNDVYGVRKVMEG